MSYILKVGSQYWADDWKKPDFEGFWTTNINKAKKFETPDEIEAIADRWCFIKHAEYTKDGKPVYARTVIMGVTCYEEDENQNPIGPLQNVVLKRVVPCPIRLRVSTTDGAHEGVLMSTRIDVITEPESLS